MHRAPLSWGWQPWPLLLPASRSSPAPWLCIRILIVAPSLHTPETVAHTSPPPRPRSRLQGSPGSMGRHLCPRKREPDKVITSSPETGLSLGADIPLPGAASSLSPSAPEDALPRLSSCRACARRRGAPLLGRLALSLRADVRGRLNQCNRPTSHLLESTKGKGRLDELQQVMGTPLWGPLPPKASWRCNSSVSLWSPGGWHCDGGEG